MRRKYAVVAIVGALVALALPSSSMALMWEPGQSFTIAGSASSPKIGLPEGSCWLKTISATIPAAPANEKPFPVSKPTQGGCTAALTMELGSGWTMGDKETNGVASLRLFGPVTIRSTAHPGCKLSGTIVLEGTWMNGAYFGDGYSRYTPASIPSTFVWSQDFGSTLCVTRSEAKLGYQGSALPAITPAGQRREVSIWEVSPL